MLEILQMILGVDASSTPLLNFYIQKATNFFLEETNLTVLPATAQDVIIELVILDWNKRGSEGITNEGNSGLTYTWSENLPPNILKRIAAYRTLVW
ncbi:MAG: phage head-tail connector protein [Sarcina sp.]